MEAGGMGAARRRLSRDNMEAGGVGGSTEEVE